MAVKEAKKVGILAYGSLIDDPGEEIADATSGTIDDVTTPFEVEFARSSQKRAGAPTLVAVEQGGAAVRGKVFLLDVTEEEAANRLWRREIDAVGSGRCYRQPKVIGVDTVVIEPYTGLAGVSVVLSTRIAPNIAPLTAERLADLAIASVRPDNDKRDGITYLLAARRHGIETELSATYEVEILRRVGALDLETALEALRSSAVHAEGTQPR